MLLFLDRYLSSSCVGVATPFHIHSVEVAGSTFNPQDRERERERDLNQSIALVFSKKDPQCAPWFCKLIYHKIGIHTTFECTTYLYY